MLLIAGLGNPEPKYKGNRHNLGFMVVDRLFEQYGEGTFQGKFNGEFAKISISAQEVVLLKPMTFMNLSGNSVQKTMHYFKIPVDDLIVVHDELDLGFGVTRIKVGGGSAGHKGVQSIVDQCGNADFVRVRVGIGRPAIGTVESYVLSGFTVEERSRLPDVLDNATALLAHIVNRGVQDAMNKFHSYTPDDGTTI
ncbi:MAG: aminoacyl-tRNA hydrolase [Deltaproteobacteria bacterium]|nr:aminoacyl-tRNA hydrolase [Deltaproteobacteria bacterium]